MNSLQRVLYSFIFCCLCLSAQAQSFKTFQKMYLEAKNRFNNGDYAASYDLFLKIARNDNSNNAFVSYSYYYAGLSAFKTDKLLDANYALYSLTKKDSTWSHINEVWYLTMNIGLEQHNIQKAYNNLNKIKDKSILKEAQNTFKFYSFKHQELIEELVILQQENPEDDFLVQLLADWFVTYPENDFSRDQLLFLVQEYKLDPKKYHIRKYRQSVKKDEYKVAVLLPFGLSSSTLPSKYSRFQELYTGIKLAVDSLKKHKVNIRLYSYDSGTDTIRTRSLIKSGELSTMDLIIGPLLDDQSLLMSEYAERKEIIFVNPLNREDDLYRGYHYSLPFIPTQKTAIKETFKYAYSVKKSDTVSIFYDDNKTDSLLAMQYKQLCLDSNMLVYACKKMDEETNKKINRYIKPDSVANLGHIMAIGSKKLLSSTIMSAVEHNSLTIPVFVSADWLDNSILSYEQFYRRSIYIVYPDYVQKTPHFKKNLHKKLKNTPYDYSYPYIGYDAMFFFGKALSKYGNNFIPKLEEIGYTKGVSMFGVQYNAEFRNTLVPILLFDEDFNLNWVNQPKKTK